MPSQSNYVTTVAATLTQQNAIRGLQEELLKGSKADFSKFCTKDCTFQVPGAPPMSMEMMASMAEGMLKAFPWKNEVRFDVVNDIDNGSTSESDVTVTTSKSDSNTVVTGTGHPVQVRAMSKQILGKMKGDIPQLGPFPAVKYDEVPKDRREKDIVLPWETGTYEFNCSSDQCNDNVTVDNEVPSENLKSEDSESKLLITKVSYPSEFEPKDLDKDATTMDLPKGMQVGFPCIYAFLGVEVSLPPSPGIMDVFMQVQVADFDDWFSCFQEHAKSKTFHYKGVKHEVSMSRSDVLDVENEEIYYDIKDKNRIVVPFLTVNMEKMGELQSDPKFKEGIKDSVVSQGPPMQMLDMPPPGVIPAELKNGIVPCMFFSYEVEDVEKWTEGFLAHGESKTGTWGVEAKYTRSEFCDESKTRVFKSAKNSKRVGGMCFDVDLKKMGEFMSDPSFEKIGEVLKFKQETMFMKQLEFLPAPPESEAPEVEKGTDILMSVQVANFADWYPCFQEHGESNVFTYKGVKHEASMSRGECLDLATEEIFCDITDENKIVAPFQKVNMAKMGALMSEPAFVEGIKDSVVSQPPPKILKDMAPGTIPEDVKNGIVPQIFFSYEVEDVDRWTEGFLAHGKSKTGIWEVEAKYTRSEFCDESKTRVFKSVKNSKRVGGMLFDVDLKKMGEFMADPSFKEIEKVLAVKMESLFMKQVVDAPAPVDA